MIYIPSIRIGGNPCGNDCTGGPCNDAEDPCEDGTIWTPGFDTGSPELPVFDTVTGQLLCGPTPTSEITPPWLLGPTFTEVSANNWVMDEYYSTNDFPLGSGELINFSGEPYAILHADYITESAGSVTISRPHPINLQASTSRYLRFLVSVWGPPCIMHGKTWTITIECPLQYSVTWTKTISVPDPSSCTPALIMQTFPLLTCKCPVDTPTSTPALPSYFGAYADDYAYPSLTSLGTFEISWSGISGLGATDAEFVITGPTIMGYPA